MERPLSIAVCDKDIDDRKYLIKLIESSGYMSLCRTYSSCEALLDGYRPYQYDLIILDIYMDAMSGIEAAKEIRLRDADVMLAFCTSSRDHTLESYRLGALKYLEKPVNEAAVIETLALADMRRNAGEKLPILIGGHTRLIPLNDIVYFEMDRSKHAVMIHMAKESYRISQSVRMKDLQAKLPIPQFLRCHRGTIVNLNRVRGFDGPDFVMDNGAKAYVRLKDERRIKAAYEEYICGVAEKRDIIASSL